MNTDLKTDIMLGRSGYASHIRLTGLNADVDTGTVPEDITNTGATYAGQPTTGNAETVTVDSASNTDEGAVVRVHGLDANYDQLTEDVTLDASGTGVTEGTFRRVYRLELITPASGQSSNVGAITANHTTTTANVFAIMAAGTGIAEGCAYTVPAGHTAYVVSITGHLENSSANAAIIALWTRSQAGAVALRDRLIADTSAPAQLLPALGIKLPARTDIRLRAVSVNGDNAAVAATMDIILVKD